MNLHFFAILALFAGAAEARPHLELDLSSAEYSHLLESGQYQKTTLADEPSIASALAIGKRLSAWIETENSRRPVETQIRLTSQATRINHPIESPSIYNPAIIQVTLDSAMKALPAEMRQVLLSTDAYPTSLPVDDAVFIKLARDVANVYQSAARWKMLKPYLSEYQDEKRHDVRGYYFLNKNLWNAEKLKNFATLDSHSQSDLKKWLPMICQSTPVSPADCETELSTAITKNQVNAYYSLYYPRAKEIWDAFFIIPEGAARKDIVWTSLNSHLLTVPFNTPQLDRIKSYLSVNIEDEWKWNDWHLRLNFGTFSDGPRVEFQSGVVPHVNELGGNIITMDEAQSTEEYESKWTIRHEFGHVLGFPDCYHEFYDDELAAFVNYQLDVTDLMCSRTGNMKERLYTELKRVYFAP